MSVLAVALLHDHARHALDALGSVVLVVSLSGHVLEVLHVCANEHVPQLHEIAVCWIFNCKATDRVNYRHGILHNTWGSVSIARQLSASTCVAVRLQADELSGVKLTFYDAPGVQAAPHPLPLGLHHSVAANYCKGNAFLKGRK